MIIYPLAKNISVIEIHKPFLPEILDVLHKIILQLIKEEVPEIHIKITEDK